MKKVNWIKVKATACFIFSVLAIIYLLSNPIKMSEGLNGNYSIFSSAMFKHFKSAQTFLVILLLLFVFLAVMTGIWTYRLLFLKDDEKTIKILNLKIEDNDTKQIAWVLAGMFLATLFLTNIAYHRNASEEILATVLSPKYYVMLGITLVLVVISLLGRGKKDQKDINDLENYLNSKDD